MLSTEQLSRYARLLVRYCLEVRTGDRVFVSTTLLAEPLLREVYREALEAGAALVEYDLAFRERDRLFMRSANSAALDTPPLLYSAAMAGFDCYLAIRAPFNLREAAQDDPDRARRRNEALSAAHRNYFERTADRRLRRNLCQYPTDAAAQEAGMGLSDYAQFVAEACKLDAPDPIAAWLEVRRA
ncbi:MAG: aminopeptidase, partial [Saprospiraceae bacterium]